MNVRIDDALIDQLVLLGMLDDDDVDNPAAVAVALAEAVQQLAEGKV